MGSNFKNIIFVFVITMITCVACLPEPLELDVKGTKPKMVVSTQSIPGYEIAVLISKSVNATEGNQDSNPIEFLSKVAVIDASVQLIGNEESFTLNHIGYGVYASRTAIIVEGSTYSLYINSPSMGFLAPVATVKPRVPFEKLDAQITVNARDTLAEINYTFQDEVGKNWYMLNAQKVSSKKDVNQLLNPTVTTKIMSDEDFDGQKKSGSFKMLFDEVKRGDTIAVTISNIDKDFYEFMKLREDTRFGIAAVLGEPINYPTNVKGGLGYFTLYSSDRREFRLLKYANETL